MHHKKSKIKKETLSITQKPLYYHYPQVKMKVTLGT